MAADPQEEAGTPPGNLTIGVIGAAFAFVVLLLVGAVIVGVAFGPSEAERGQLAEARSRNLDEDDAARLWSARCASCHGPGGQGLTAPGSRRVSERLSLEEHIAIVRDGLNSMPAFGPVLLDAEIDAVVAHQRTVLDGR